MKKLTTLFLILLITIAGSAQNQLKPDIYNPVFAEKKVRSLTISPLNFNIGYDADGRLIEFYSINDKNELLRILSYDSIQNLLTDRVVIFDHQREKTRTDTFSITVPYHDIKRTLNKMTVHIEDNPLLNTLLKSNGSFKDTLYINFLSAEYYEFDSIPMNNGKTVRYHVLTYDEQYRLKREEVFLAIDTFPTVIKVYEYDLNGNLAKIIERNPKFSRICRRTFDNGKLAATHCDIKQSSTMNPSQIEYIYDKKSGLLKEEIHSRKGMKDVTLKYKYFFSK